MKKLHQAEEKWKWQEAQFTGLKEVGKVNWEQELKENYQQKAGNVQNRAGKITG